MIDLGDVHVIARDIFDANDHLATPASSELVITKPYGSAPPTDTPAVPAPTDEGKLRIPYTTTVPGRHTWVLTTASPNTVTTDVFHVRQPDPLFIIGLTDAKDQLKITATGEDEILRGFIAATTRVMEHYVGPIVARAYTERHFAGSEIILRNKPVLELTSITPVLTGGLAIDAATEVNIDKATGLILRLDGGMFTGGPWDVATKAGLAIIPENWLTAALMIIQHLWETRRVPRRSAVSVDTVEAADGTGRWYSVPRRALELLTPDRVA